MRVLNQDELTQVAGGCCFTKNLFSCWNPCSTSTTPTEPTPDGPPADGVEPTPGSSTGGSSSCGLDIDLDASLGCGGISKSVSVSYSSCLFSCLSFSASKSFSFGWC